MLAGWQSNLTNTWLSWMSISHILLSYNICVLRGTSIKYISPSLLLIGFFIYLHYLEQRNLVPLLDLKRINLLHPFGCINNTWPWISPSIFCFFEVIFSEIILSFISQNSLIKSVWVVLNRFHGSVHQVYTTMTCLFFHCQGTSRR